MHVTLVRRVNSEGVRWATQGHHGSVSVLIVIVAAAVTFGGSGVDEKLENIKKQSPTEIPILRF